MKRKPLFLLVILSLLLCGAFVLAHPTDKNKEVIPMKTIHFTSADGVEITADDYPVNDSNAPFILLFHQASYSRGEYREIAPKLNQMGYHCLAIDQRSGNLVHGVKNETTAAAKALKKGSSYTDAYPDLEAALKYVKDTYKPKKLIIWGSSYSSSLSVVLCAEHPEGISGLLLFSPGEYFQIDGHSICSFAEKVQCPVFITSARSEVSTWKKISESFSAPIKEKSLFYQPKEEGIHGSSTLLSNVKNKDEYWTAVEKFLKGIK